MLYLFTYLFILFYLLIYLFVYFLFIHVITKLLNKLFIYSSIENIGFHTTSLVFREKSKTGSWGFKTRNFGKGKDNKATTIKQMHKKARGCSP